MFRLGGPHSCVAHSHHSVGCLRILFLLSNVVSQRCHTDWWRACTADGSHARCVEFIFPVQQLLSLSGMPCKEFIPNRAGRSAHWEALAHYPLSVKDPHICGVLVLLFYWAEKRPTPNAFVCEAPGMVEGSFEYGTYLVCQKTYMLMNSHMARSLATWSGRIACTR